MTTQTGIEALPLAPTGPLPAMLAPHLDAIRALCREYEVVRLEVFGSALTPRFDPATSDIDLLVEYPPGHDLGLWAEKHTGLAERLSAVLGRHVDLVMMTAIRKPRFIEAVRESRRLLYAA